jgi:ELWxxDGT repeat protein
VSTRGRKAGNDRAPTQVFAKKRLERRPRRTLPCLEALEDRLLPSLTPYLVADISPGKTSSSPALFANVSGTLFFSATDGVHGHELWRSDGTAAGTTIVADVNPALSPGGIDPQYLINVNGTLFFRATDGVHGFQLWRSDGTAGGTTMIGDFNTQSSYGFDPRLLTNVSGTVLFRATDGAHGYQLWRSNGTAAGTTMVTDLGGGFVPNALANVNGTLFFAADNGAQLWRSNGTAEGTVVVKDIGPGNVGFFEDMIGAMNGTLFFDGNDGVHGEQLWHSDGTPAGTGQVADLQSSSPSGGSYPSWIENVNGTLFFGANTSALFSPGLWRSDGTPTGTTMISGALDDPVYLTNVQGTLFFSAQGNGQGFGLWQSNGTAAGTSVIVSGVSNPGFLANVNGTLFFSASDGVHGTELWALPVAPVARANTTTAITASDNSPVYGETVTYTAAISAVSPGTGSPSDGTVTFRFDGGAGVTANVSNGKATITKQWLTAGSGNTVDATFNGDDSAGDFSASTASQLSVTISRASTDTSFAFASAATHYFGNVLMFTATVTPVGGFGSPSGTVTFKDGATTLGSTGTLDAGTHQATFTISSLGAGTHTITAVYGSDSNFQASTSSSQVVAIARAVALTTISLSMPNGTNGNGSSVYGQTWAATGTVKAAAGLGGGSPSGGTVLFTDTILTNSSSSGTFLIGAKTTFTLGSATVSTGGIAVLNTGVAAGLVLPGVITAYLANGTQANITPVIHEIKAQYSGSANFTASVLSAGLGEIISRDATQTVIKAATPNPAQYAQVVTITATVTSVGGLIAPLGSVTFTDSYTQRGITTNTTLGTVILPSVSAGVGQVQATFTTASLTQVAHSLHAIYNGDTAAPFPLPGSFPYRGQWLPSTSLVYGLPVRGDTTTATLSANPSSGQKAGVTITFVDSLTATAGGMVHGGIVVFKDGTSVLGTTSVDIRGKATLLTGIAGPVGTHSITAYYAGSMNFNASTSNTLAYTIMAHNATAIPLAPVLGGEGQGEGHRIRRSSSTLLHRPRLPHPRSRPPNLVGVETHRPQARWSSSRDRMAHRQASARRAPSPAPWSSPVLPTIGWRKPSSPPAFFGGRLRTNERKVLAASREI